MMNMMKYDDDHNDDNGCGGYYYNFHCRNKLPCY